MSSQTFEDVRVDARVGFAMIGYFALSAAAVGGFAGLGTWVIGVIALALTALSFTDIAPLYQRAEQNGFTWVTRSTLIQAVSHALTASGICYAAGAVFRLG